MTADERLYLDGQGNRNGFYDLGDLLAYVERTGATLDEISMQQLLAKAGHETPTLDHQPASADSDGPQSQPIPRPGAEHTPSQLPHE
jgi:hypothetical protein